MSFIHRYERFFLGITFATLVVGLVAIVVSIVVADVRIPSPVQRVDPTTLRTTPPFDAPGVRDNGDGTFEAVMIAQAWAFSPALIEVPQGSTVTFTIASVDVVHGFLIQGTNANLTIIPGQVSQATATFDEPGEYLFVCHEYCGIGHQRMFGRVVVQ